MYKINLKHSTLYIDMCVQSTHLYNISTIVNATIIKVLPLFGSGTFACILIKFCISSVFNIIPFFS